MSHGIKSLANNLAQYGRNGDTMVAHINPQEAAMLKKMGGSGTINPTTGLPEFSFLSKAWHSVSDPVARAIDPIAAPISQILKPVEQLTLQPFSKGLAAIDKAVIQPVTTPIGKGLGSIDDAVGRAVPGGWGTLAQIAASFIPGVGPLTLGAMGAINGSGVLRGDNKFNLQGAMAGGAMSYGMASLGEYARMADPSAVPSTVTASGQLANAPVDTLAANATSYVPSIDPDLGITGAAMTPPPPPSIAQNVMSGNLGNAASQIGTNISNAASNVGDSILSAPGKIADSAVSAFDKLTTSGTYTDALSSAGDKLGATIEGAGTKLGETGTGIKNLLGAGDVTFSEAGKLAARSGINPLTAAAATLYGGTGLMAVEEQKKQLEEQLAAGKIAQADYNAAVAEIDRTADIGKAAVAKSPFNTNPDRSTSIGDTFYARNQPADNLYSRGSASDRLYASGGVVNPPDDQTNLYSQTPLQNMQESTAKTGLGSNAAQGVSPQIAATYPQYQNNMQPLVGPVPNGRLDQSGKLGLMGLQELLRGFKPNQQPPQMLGDESPPIDYQNPMQEVPFGQNDQPKSFYDDLRGGPNGGNYPGGGGYPGIGGGGGGAGGAFPLQGQYGIVKMAAGGMPPRFLSGGGDGMSDSIRASIDGKQEARLADGEFVVPADVVSHLGNGSSKAGAKQLYSMMNKVRRARTGNPEQGKQINPNKYMPA